jgi:predicted nucleic acid-binding protein
VTRAIADTSAATALRHGVAVLTQDAGFSAFAAVAVLRV